ncbi:MAG: hypothetical protein Q8N56_00040 [bacterium]|nr:hypothetical protein [bacterium]
MVTPELIAFIKKQLQAGKMEGELRSLLVGKGWLNEDVEEAFKAVSAPPASVFPGQPAVIASEAKPFSQQQVQPVQPMGQGAESFGAGSDDILTEEETKQIYGQPSLKKRPLKKILAVFAIFAGIALLAGAGFAAYSYFFQSPEKIMAKSMAQSAEIKSAKYSGSIDFSIQVTGDPFSGILSNNQGSVPPAGSPFSAGMNVDFSMNFNGGFDSADPEKMQGFLNLDLMNKSQSDSEIQKFLGLETRYLNNVVYIVLNQVPGITPEFSALKDQWLKIDPEEIKAMVKNMGLTEDQLTEFDKAFNQQALTQEKKDAIEKLVMDSKLLKITAKLDGEKIDSQNTYHYQYVIKKDSFKKFVLELDKIMEIEVPVDADKVLDSYQDVTGEIWIGKKDFLMRKFTVNIAIEIDEQNGKAVAQMKVTALASDFNKPVAVEAPATSQSFVELIKNYLGLFMGQVDCSAKPVADRDDCYLQLAVISLDTGDCQKVVALAKKYDCYILVAKGKKDEAVCNLVVNRNWKDECYRAVAEVKRDPQLCQMIYSANWKNYCLAGALRDASYCQAIKIASTKQACLNALQP